MGIGIYVLMALLIMISVWDGITYRIPNAFVMIGTVIGFGVSFYEKGWSGVKTTSIEVIVSLLVFFIIWCILELLHFPAIGAGDMKLFVMMSSYIGFLHSLGTFFLSVILISVLFVFITPPRNIKAMFDQLIYLLLYFIPSNTPKNLRKIAFSFPILIGYLLQVYVF